MNQREIRRSQRGTLDRSGFKIRDRAKTVMLGELNPTDERSFCLVWICYDLSQQCENAIDSRIDDLKNALMDARRSVSDKRWVNRWCNEIEIWRGATFSLGAMIQRNSTISAGNVTRSWLENRHLKNTVRLGDCIWHTMSYPVMLWYEIGIRLTRSNALARLSNVGKFEVLSQRCLNVVDSIVDTVQKLWG